jgi:hypothetical protein
MGKFALKGHFPILEFKLMRGPMVFLKVGDRQIEIRKANRIQGKYFQTQEGIFELEGEYEYRLMGQSCYIHNLYNSKPISLSGIEKIQRLYRNNKAELVTKELDRINTAIQSATGMGAYVDPIKAMKEIQKHTPDELSRDDQKFLVDYKTFDKDDLKLLNIQKMTDKRVHSGMSTKVSAILPMLILMGGVMGTIVAMRFFNPLYLFGWG